MSRRRFLLNTAFGAVTITGLAGIVAAAVPRPIAVKAAKFAFTPNEIRIRKHEPVVFVLTAEDFPHGFSLPDFKVRADFVPGKTIELNFVADKVGRFHLLCDNFCGEGHDMMSAWLIVTEA
jgi:cytochrome c oxidase subunit 2